MSRLPIGGGGGGGGGGGRAGRGAHAPRLPARQPRYLLRRVVSAAVFLVVVSVAVSVIGAWRTPGNQDFKAKWADWLRSHHAAVLVNHMEAFYYSHQAPSRGGQPKGLNALPSAQPDPPAPGGSTSRGRLGSPAPVPLVVQPGLAGEGQWVPAGPLVGGRAAMFVAQFRADQIYTSQITSAVWIDPTVLKVALIPGASEPGGTWSEAPDITGSARATAVAAFNGGFRFQDAHGGFYLDGKQAVPLRTGAASIVMYTSGKVDVGTWGQEVTMTPDVRAVLQNLVPIVDQGQTAPAATYGDARIWGATLGANTVVARSGVGVTANGALLYVAGPALTARSLAESLQRAGAVRAMTLDLNPEWVTFNFYQHDVTQPNVIAPAKLYPQMQRPASRYLGPTRESRDFFTVSLAGS